MDALSNAIRASTPTPPLPSSRRAEELVLTSAARATGAEPLLQRRSVEPIFRRPAVDAARERRQAEPALGSRAGAGAKAAEAAPLPEPPPAPEFEWIDLEIVPFGQKPDPRGYGVYAKGPRPEPAPVVLIDAAL
ncbi:MAG: hypothetical protein NDI82_06220 [Anaeromyxobacteraceae bacterium]|nr:hypothetical protein [Anaeromyxobacteraceae bacterium]